MKNHLKDPERVYSKVASTMRMEKFSLEASDELRIKKCLSGEKSFSSTKQELIQKHTKVTFNA
jgi:hypothetical protein